MQGMGFYRMQASGTIGANKCWMEWTTPEGKPEARAIRLRFEGATDITYGQKDEPKEMPVFNLAGQRLNALHKGINIVGNRKVILR